MMNFADVVASTTFNVNVVELDGIQFRVGIVEKMPVPLGISVSDVVYGDGSRMGAVIFSLSDVNRYIKIHGENFTRKFLTFVAGHEIGHLKDFAVDPPKFGGLSISIDREAEADAWMLSHTKTGIYLYRRFMSMLSQEAEKLEQETFRVAAIVGVVNKIDGFNYNRRIKAAIRKADTDGKKYSEISEIAASIVEIAKDYSE